MAPKPLSVRLPEAEEAQLAQHAEQIAVPPGTLARLAILSVLGLLDDPDVLKGFAEQALEEVLENCPEGPARIIGLNAN